MAELGIVWLSCLLCLLLNDSKDSPCLLVVWCRLYTGIHAQKPKPKFKSGAISESTAALNVDQTNADQRYQAPATTLDLLSTTAKGGNFQEQQQTAVAPPLTEIGVSGSTPAIPAAAQKREAGLAKAPADKKKMNARKKSLKRL